MKVLSKLRRRLRALFAKPGLDRDMDEEMRFHLALEAEDLSRAGLSNDEAARRARVKFGAVENHKETARDGRGVLALETIVRDLSYIVRALRRAPAFTMAVVLSLALGIGANSTMFTIIHAVLLRPLPYANGEALLGISGDNQGSVSPQVLEAHYREWAARNHTLSAIAIYDDQKGTVVGSALPEYVSGAEAGPELFGLVGITIERGRLFTHADQDSAAAPIILLGDALWRSHFSADPDIVGKIIQFNDRPRTVVGVVRAGSEFPIHAQFWYPWRRPSGKQFFFFGSVVALPRPGVPLAQVQKELVALTVAADSALPAGVRGSKPVAMTLHDQLYGSSRTALAILFAAVLLLMLIACANVANLVFARTLQRQREFAVRMTLGASRRTLVWLVLAESLLLALAGAAVGLVLSLWGTRVFVGLSPASVSSVPDIGLNAKVFAFTALLAVLSALVVGVGPALRSSRRDPRSSLGEGSVREGTGRFAKRMRSALVAAQLSIAVVLLAGAGLLLRSLDRLSSIDLGFRPSQLLIVNVSLPNQRYPGRRGREFFDQLGERMHRTAGVSGVAYGIPPLLGFISMRTLGPQSTAPGVTLAEGSIGPNYFETYGVAIREGRGILATDDSASAPVVVLNASAAKVFFPAGHAVGQQFAEITIDEGTQHPTVVGVVADFPQRDVAQRPMPEAFRPSAQTGGHPYTLGIRATGEAVALTSIVRGAVHDLDPTLALGTVNTMEKIVATSTASTRFASLLLGVFATLALMLAALGLYGVIAYGVARRSRELGIRAALGATGRGLMMLVAGEMVWVVALGLFTGLGGAWLLARVMAKLLYGTQVHDPLTFVLVPAALVVTASIATIVPARKALRVNPMEVIQAD